MSNAEQTDSADRIREHSYDGIQEYDKRLPNWWLITLYGAIIFAVGYGLWYHKWGNIEPDTARLQRERTEFAMKVAAKSGAALTDDQLWEVSQNAETVSKGQEIYMTTCIGCHGPELKGGVGVNLVDNQWLHGGKPTEIIHTITNGVVEKGMLAWGPVLGQQKITHVAAFILSHHRKGEDGAALPR